jgi:putative flippase GtrA
VIKKELFRFALVGISTVAIAYMIYRGLASLGLDKNISNGTAYACGVFLSFFANKTWTFNSANNSHTSFRFLLLHCGSLFACVSINAIAYHLLGALTYKFEIAFLLSIMTSTLINFVGMKFYVFSIERDPTIYKEVTSEK